MVSGKACALPRPHSGIGGVDAEQPARIPPPLTFDHMFNIYLNPEFIKKSSGKGKQWLSRAMVNMLVVDKSIHHSELSYLEDAIGMVETEEEREELKKISQGT